MISHIISASLLLATITENEANTKLHIGTPKTLGSLGTYDSCSYHRLLPSVKSNKVALWTSQRRLLDPLDRWIEFAVADLRMAEQGNSTSWLTGIENRGRLEPLGWTRGDRLIFRMGEKGVGVYDASKKRLLQAPALDPFWDEVRIRSVRYGDLNALRSRASLETLHRIRQPSPPLRALATVGQSTDFLVVRYGNHFRYTVETPAGSRQSNVSAMFTQMPLALPDEDGAVTFLGDQRDPKAFLPYAQPLIDFRRGKAIGRFGWERIEIGRGARKRVVDLKPVFNQLMVIRDAAANGSTIFALVDLEREGRIVRIRGNEIRSFPLCEKKGLHLTDSRIPVGRRDFPGLTALPAGNPVTRTLVRFDGGAPADRAGAFGFLYRPANADGRLIVRFHGGPQTTLAADTAPESVIEFTPDGISVLEVEYSGTIGGGLHLSERLPRLGFAAIREDVDGVTRWVRASGYRHVSIIGDSFGAVPAVAAAVDHPTDYEKFFLRVPALAIHSAERTVKRGAIGGDVVPASQIEADETIFGGAEGLARLDADLRAYVAKLTPSPRLSFYFGSLDPVSDVDDLPPAFRGSQSVMVLKGGHAFATSVPEVTEDIKAKLRIAPGEERPGGGVK